jgi:Ca2+-binding EF-hand superfamily protein
MLRAKELSLFDVFVRMDVNKSGCLTKIELKTGIQSLGIVITQSEMDMLWKSIMVHVKKKPTEVKEEPSWKRTLT